jgi:predicted transposase YbfD/YdcC
VVGSFVRYFEQRDGRPDSNEWVVTSKGEHGRQEKRTYVVFDDVSGIRHPEKWRDVKRLIMVLRQCEKSDGTWEEASRYFIGSADSGVAAYAKWVRDHWGIENSLHWVLDVIFNEDASRVRKDHGTENLAMLRRLAVSVLGNDKSFKRSLKGKRKKAARNNQYLEHVLLGFSDPDTPLETQKTVPSA